MIITSPQNPLIKKVLALREPKARREAGLFLIDGAREILRASAAGIEITRVFICPATASDQENKVVKGLKLTARDVLEVSDNVVNKIGYGDRGEALIAEARIPRRTLGSLSRTRDPWYVVLEAVEKPGNLGAIARTCDAAGVTAILVADPRTDVFNPNVIRASTGAIFALPVVSASAGDILEFLRQQECRIAGLFPDAPKSYTQEDLKGPLAIVLGAEDQGLSEFWAQKADARLRIPMRGCADSLNVSVTAAVVVFEALRQRSPR